MPQFYEKRRNVRWYQTRSPQRRLHCARGTPHHHTAKFRHQDRASFFGEGLNPGENHGGVGESSFGNTPGPIAAFSRTPPRMFPPDSGLASSVTFSRRGVPTRRLPSGPAVAAYGTPLKRGGRFWVGREPGSKNNSWLAIKL